MKLYHFPERQTKPRTCAGCGVPLPKLTPAWHYACRECYRHHQFRKAVETFRQVRP